MQMSKWNAWYDSLPEHTKQYIKSQPIWYDRDMIKAFAWGAVFGIIIGLAV